MKNNLKDKMTEDMKELRKLIDEHYRALQYAADEDEVKYHHQWIFDLEMELSEIEDIYSGG